MTYNVRNFLFLFLLSTLPLYLLGQNSQSIKFAKRLTKLAAKVCTSSAALLQELVVIRHICEMTPQQHYRQTSFDVIALWYNKALEEVCKVET